MESLIQAINNFVWGPYMLALLLLTGLFLTVGLKFISIYKVPYAFKQLFRKRGANTDEGDVSPFAALMTALSSTIGTGNIAGVAAAIAIGGPGAIFWMWMTAIVGTATKFSEGVLAVRYREIDANGNRVGGPMYYIKNGLGSKWIWLAFAFAFFGMFASWGTGNSIQANSVADVLNFEYGLSPWITATVLAIGAGAVILGGIKRIGSVASKVVPFMAATYIILGLTIVFINIDAVPAAFGMIFESAFGLQEAGTGITMGLMWLAMQKGVARGIFSNEAGQGSAPIAHAAAQNNDPVNQGTIAMLGTVIDTLFVCTITALVILTSGVVDPICLAGPENYADLIKGVQPVGCDTGAPLTSSAFSAVFGEFGRHVIPISLSIFAFTTILGWSYYGERCAAFLFSEKAITPYRLIYIAVVFFSAAAIAFQKRVLEIAAGNSLSVNADGELVSSGTVVMNNGEPVTQVILPSNDVVAVGELFDGTGVAPNVVDNVLTLGGEAIRVDGPIANIVNLFWLMADTLTGLMAAPNLIALLLLSPIVFRLTRDYFNREKEAADGLVDQDDLPRGS